MKTIAMAKTIAEITDGSTRTARSYVQTLQIGGLVRQGVRGRHGGAEMGESDCINALLAASLNHPRGEGLVKSVRRIRAMELRQVVTIPKVANDETESRIRTVFSFASGLSIANILIKCGEALETIVRDMRDGTFDKWAGARQIALSAKFDERNRSAVIAFQELNDDGRSVALYFSHGDGKKAVMIERSVTWDTAVFRRFAEGLGPMPK